MKKDIHPIYYKNTKVTCSCGANFEISSTIPELKVEICSACHPLYTGNKRMIDTAGRLDRFKERMKKTKNLKDRLDSTRKNVQTPAKDEELEAKKSTMPETKKSGEKES